MILKPKLALNQGRWYALLTRLSANMNCHLNLFLFIFLVQANLRWQYLFGQSLVRHTDGPVFNVEIQLESYKSTKISRNAAKNLVIHIAINIAPPIEAKSTPNLENNRPYSNLHPICSSKYLMALVENRYPYNIRNICKRIPTSVVYDMPFQQSH